MLRPIPLFLGVLLLVGQGLPAWGASQRAAALRQANGLTRFTPPERFLAGNFVADEMNPAFIFGTVKSFVASRQCPTTWLIGGKGRPAPSGSPDQPGEYTVYLEEDCPDRVVYYVFIDQSGLTPQQWIEWREKFHKSKTEPEYGDTKSKLDQACQDGCGVGAELRFIQRNGELAANSPEEILRQELKFAPIYDLNRLQKISR
jgi:hypothetical protein